MGCKFVKKFILALSFFLICISSLVAVEYSRPRLDCACGNWYFGGFGGYNWVAKNGWKIPPNPVPPSSTNPTPASTTFLPHFNLRQYKPGYVAGGSIGYRWSNQFRFELEGSYRYNQLKHNYYDGSNHQATAILANGIYQFHFEFLYIDVFFGGGLGYCNTYHRHHEKSVTSRDGFAWQFLGGLAYPAWKKLDITFEYRFFNEARAKFRNSSVDIGLRYYL